MKLCRFQPLEFAAADIARAPHQSHPHVRHGVIEANTVHEFSGELWGSRERTGQKWPLDSVKFLPPSVPSKIICVGKNYVDHAAEMGGPPPKSPIIFLKPPSAIIAPEEPIILPPHLPARRLRRRNRHHHRPPLPPPRSQRRRPPLHPRLHLLQRRHRPRPPETRRPMDPRQKLRHFLSLRSATGVRPQSCRYQSRDLRQRRQETVRQRLGNDLFR